MNSLLKPLVWLLLFCLLLSSCSGAGKVDAPTETGPSESDTGEVTAVPEDAVIFKDGGSLYTVVRADKANGAIVSFTTKFRNRLSEAAGCELGISSDFIHPKTPYDPDSYEILIGETNRDESIKLYEDIATSGISGYIIRVDRHKLLIGGSDEYMLYCALGYVLNSLAAVGANGSSSLVLPEDYEYIAAGLSLPSPEDVIESGKDFSMFPVKKVITLQSQEGYATLQGGGTDGTYAYFGFINSSSNDMSRIYKVDLKTWKVVKISEPLPTAHTNDITYNSKLGLLVVSNCAAADGYRGISFIDPENLTLVEYVVSPVANRGIHYLAETDRYILAGGYNYVITDSDFNALRTSMCGNPQYTTQGLFSDGKYIYDVRYASASGTNYITINTVDGKYIGTAELSGVNGEPEHIFRIGNEFYIGFNKASYVYEAILLPTGWWE